MDYEFGSPLDLRKLLHFVVIAEELHFGRAAERLYISQPALSRQIRQLEHELGTNLLERTSRNVGLTPAGRRVLDEARMVLAAADAAQRRMSSVARGGETLTIGFFTGDVFTAALRDFSAERPDVDVKVHRICWNDQIEVLHDGRADIAFLHLPVDESGLGLVPVRAEPRVAALPADHRAATGRAVAIAELADDPVILQGGASDAWQAFHNVDPRPDGRHPRPGPAADNLEEKLLHVAAGRGISFLPASSAAVYAQRDVAYVPVADIPPIQVCLGWSASRFSPAIKSFIEAVKRTARREVRQPAWPRRKPTRSSSSEEPTTSRPR